MNPNPHFRDLLNLLNGLNAEYLIVGGYAVMLYSEPRHTKDLDIWVNANPENAQRVFHALAEFGAPLAGVKAGDFEKPDLIYQLGMPPSRIDVLTSIMGVQFADAWARRKEALFGGVRAPFIGLEDLLRNKRSVGRKTDLADIERLEEANSG